MLALPGASGVLAATGDEPASTGFWAAVDSVGKLYAIKGRQLADDVKTNYLQLAGGDPDDLDVPSAIIEDGFMDGGGEQPAGKASPEADPEPAPEAAQQAAPATQDDAPTPVEAEAVETAPIETAPAETAPAAETAESRLPMTLPMSSPVRVPPTETASGAGTLTLEDAEAPIKPAIPLDGGASAAQEALVARLASLKASFAALDAYLGETSDAAEPEATLGRIRSFAASFHKACRDNERAEHQRKKKAEAAARLKEMEKAGGAVGAGGLRRSIRTRPGPRPGPSHYMRRIDASLQRGEVAQMGRLHDNIKDELNSILKAGAAARRPSVTGR